MLQTLEMNKKDVMETYAEYSMGNEDFNVTCSRDLKSPRWDLGLTVLYTKPMLAVLMILHTAV